MQDRNSNTPKPKKSFKAYSSKQNAQYVEPAGVKESLLARCELFSSLSGEYKSHVSGTASLAEFEELEDRIVKCHFDTPEKHSLPNKVFEFENEILIFSIWSSSF